MLYYAIIPFVASLMISALAIHGYTKLGFKNFYLRRNELKIQNIETETKVQSQRTEFIMEQFNLIYERIKKTDEKIDELQKSIKWMDDKLIETETIAIKSQNSLIPPMQYYTSNSNNNTSHHNHDIKSQNSVHSIDQIDERQNGTIEYILKKLSDDSLTTTEIQAVVGRTREHTSRLMKKLYEEKLVDRDMNMKPFKYTITDEGRKRLSKHSALEIHSRLSNPKLKSSSG
jgi:predicted transcriptional regulator